MRQRTSSNQSKSGRKDVELAHETARMCARCETIDVESLLDPQLEVPLHGLHVLSLGNPNSKEFRKLCPLCELFLSVATRYKRVYRLELRLFDRVEESPFSQEERMSNVHKDDGGVDQRFLAVVRQNKKLVYDYNLAHEIVSRGLLLPYSFPFRHACSIDIVNRSSVRYDLLTDWLENCAVSHGESCRRSNENNPSIQLYGLDCLNNTIVPLSQNEKYVALSYVWGTTADAARFSVSTTNDDRVITLQPSDIPLTIRDAIEVVKEIGKRYLWVDRYCIPQSDISQRREAILNMNQIYAGAEVTIVALYGNNIRAGLPGVSSISRSGLQQVST